MQLPELKCHKSLIGAGTIWQYLRKFRKQLVCTGYLRLWWVCIGDLIKGGIWVRGVFLCLRRACQMQVSHSKCLWGGGCGHDPVRAPRHTPEPV